MSKSKTHFPEVPIQVAERIAEQELSSEQEKENRGEQLRVAIKKRRAPGSNFSASVDVKGEQK